MQFITSIMVNITVFILLLIMHYPFFTILSLFFGGTFLCLLINIFYILQQFDRIDRPYNYTNSYTNSYTILYQIDPYNLDVFVFNGWTIITFILMFFNII